MSNFKVGFVVRTRDMHYVSNQGEEIRNIHKANVYEDFRGARYIADAMGGGSQVIDLATQEVQYTTPYGKF